MPSVPLSPTVTVGAYVGTHVGALISEERLGGVGVWVRPPTVNYSDAATIVRELVAFSEEKEYDKRTVNYVLKTMHSVKERLFTLLDKERGADADKERGERGPPADVQREFERLMEERRLADEAVLHQLTQQEELAKVSYSPEFVKSVIVFFTKLSELQRLEQTVSIARTISFELTAQLSDLVHEVEMIEGVKAGVAKLMSTVSTRVARKNKLVQSMEGQFADLERELTELDAGTEFIKGMQAEINAKTQSISQVVNCVVCLEEKRVSELSVNKNCGHVLCTPCADRISSDSALCPTCRGPFSCVKIFV